MLWTIILHPVCKESMGKREINKNVCVYIYIYAYYHGLFFTISIRENHQYNR